MIPSIDNPKALLFFMVFLPQFVEPERGHVTSQLALLGALSERRATGPCGREVM